MAFAFTTQAASKNKSLGSAFPSKVLLCLKNKHPCELTFLLQVVKAFVVLSVPFKSSDPEKLTLELQAHVKKSTAPYKYPRKASILPKS